MAASAATSGTSLVSVGKSALYDRNNSENLSRTPASAGNTTTWTFSTWLNRGYISRGTVSVFEGWVDVNNRVQMYYNSTTDVFTIWFTVSSTGKTIDLSEVHRGTGWYNIVVRWDYTQTVNANKVIIYVNGVAATLDTAQYHSTSTASQVNGDNAQYIGTTGYGTGYEFDGYMAETVMIDGQALTAESFGEFDSTGLYWTPLSSATIKALTFGTNGFYLDNATNAQTDASGEGNNWTNNNTVTLSTNTPTNLNALWNPLSAVGLTTRFPNLTIGNTKAGWDGSTSARAMPTFPVSFNTHLEFTVTQGSGASTAYPYLQVFDYHDYTTALVQQGSAGAANDAGLASGESVPNWTTGDRVTLEIDTANGRIYVWIDGSAVNSANPGAGSGYTFDFTMPSSGELAIVWINQTADGFTTIVSNPDDFTDSVSSGYYGLTSTTIASQTTRTASDTDKYFQTILYEGNGAGQRVGQFQPFGNAFTVANGALFINANSEDLSRGSMGSTGSSWTFSAWVKRAEPAVGSTTANFVFTTASDAGLAFGNNSTADVLAWYSGSYTASTRVFNDQASWIHVVVKNDGGTGTAYVNGVEILSSLTVNSADATMAIGSYNNASNFFDGYMSEVVFIDGTALAPSSFGQTDTSTNRWIPSDVTGLTYGTNGFYLNFSNGSDLGEDQENSNDFTNNNTVVQVTDSPTTNLAVLNPNTGSVATLSNGNRTVTSTGEADNMNALSTIPLTGKVYFEFQTSTLGTNCSVGLTSVPYNYDDYAGGDTGSWGWYFSGGTLYYGGAVASSAPATLANGVRGCIALDMDTGSMWTGQVSSTTITWDNSGNPETGANPITTAINTDLTWYALISGRGSSVVTAHFASADWTGSTNRPASFSALNQDNISSSDQFISALAWIKNRDQADAHWWTDRVRGATKALYSNGMVDEATYIEMVQRFLAGGVQIGDYSQVNTANESFVLWNWMMEATGSGTSNEDGTINTTSTLVDTTLGMSISTYTGSGANATIGHGLGVAPEVVIIKCLDGGTTQWMVYHSALGGTKALFLDATSAEETAIGYWNNTDPTSSVVSLGTSSYLNNSGDKNVAYCFAPSQFISIGSYTGNTDANGTFVPMVNSAGVPISPVWVLIKRSSTAGQNWMVVDSTRQTYNVQGAYLFPNASDAEGNTTMLDFVTGGIKLRVNNTTLNNGTHVYMAMGTPVIDTDGRIIAGR